MNVTLRSITSLAALGIKTKLWFTFLAIHSLRTRPKALLLGHKFKSLDSPRGFRRYVLLFKFLNTLVGIQVKTTLNIRHQTVLFNVFLHSIVDKLFTISDKNKTLPTGLRFHTSNVSWLVKVQLGPDTPPMRPKRSLACYQIRSSPFYGRPESLPVSGRFNLVLRRLYPSRP